MKLSHYLPIALFISPLLGSEMTLKSEEFSSTLQLEAQWVPSDYHSVSILPQKWKELVVVEAVPQGTVVKKGQPLLQLETESLKKEIETQRKENQSRKLKLNLAELEYSHLQVTTKREKARVELEFARKKEDHDYALQVTLPNAKKNALLQYESAVHRLEYSQEEYDQLKKMYQADDLTEETEEIILKRTKRSVERAKRAVEQAKRSSDWTIKVKLERDKADWATMLQAAKSKKEIELKKLSLALSQSKETLDKERTGVDEWEKYVAQLEQDLQLMALASPADGVLYYGSFEKGPWSDAMVQKMLVKGGKIGTKGVLMTVVDGASKLTATSYVSADQKAFLRKGQNATARLLGVAQESSLKVELVSDNVSLGGKWKVSLRPNSKLEGFAQAGSKVQCEVITNESQKRIMVPLEAISTNSAGIAVVRLKMADGSVSEKVVTTGIVTKDQVEIVDGVVAGQVIDLKGP